MKSLKKLIVASALLTCTVTQAGMPVIDIPGIVRLVALIQTYIVQTQQMISAAKQLQALTGGRGFSALIGATIQDYLDEEWYRAVQSTNATATTKAKVMMDRLGIKKNCGVMKDIDQKICQMKSYAALNDYASLQRANQISTTSREVLDALKALVSMTADQKAGQELQSLIDNLHAKIALNHSQVQLATATGSANVKIVEELEEEQQRRYWDKPITNLWGLH